jgi:thymidine phosphorylase
MRSKCVNAVEFLTGKHRDPRLESVTLALAAEMLVVSELDDSPATALLHGESGAR